MQRQLKALKLQKFEENIRSLAQLWFSDDEKTVRTEVSDELENYAFVAVFSAAGKQRAGTEPCCMNQRTSL